MQDFYTIGQAAEKMQVNERFIRDAISNGKLKAYKQGKRQYILHSDLIDFIRAGKTKTHEKE